MKSIKGYKSLTVYQKAFSFAMTVYGLTKKFPKEEQFDLTSQVRRSSRSVGANIVEAYRKRAYPNHFKNKLTTSDGECSETFYWLEIAHACGYITQAEVDKLELEIDEIGRMLNSMMKNPEKFKPRT